MQIPENLARKYLPLLNEALKLEHGAAIQYAAHAEQVTGLFAEPVISRLQDSQHDEEKHADILRGLIGDYFNGVPVMECAPCESVDSEIKAILNANITAEKKAIASYQKILSEMETDKQELLPIYARVEHDIRHILMEEQEHIAELERLE